jgi:hypothetical protein
MRRRLVVAVGLFTGAALVALTVLFGTGAGTRPSELTRRQWAEPSSPSPPVLHGIQQLPVTQPEISASAGSPVVRVRVSSASQVARDAVVQLVRVSTGSAASIVAGPVRTDPNGIARFSFLPSREDRDWYIEAVRVKSWGYSRVLSHLDTVGAIEGRTQEVQFPAAGTFQVDLSALPQEARPMQVDLRFFPATEAHRALVPDVPPSIPEIGLQRLFAEHLAHVPVDESGLSIPVEIPPDHVVVPSIVPRESGWMLVAQDYTGPRAGKPWETPVMAVRAGEHEVYDTRWSRLPTLEIRIADATTGLPAPGAEVWVGVRPEHSSRRRFVHHYAPDREGVVGGRLELGPVRPGWSLVDADVVLVTSARGFRTQVSIVPFSWDTIRAGIPIHRDSGLSWTIHGRIAWKDGDPAGGLQCVVSPVSLRGIQFPVSTDEHGRFELRLTEADMPLFFEGGWGLASILPVLREEQVGGVTYRIGFGEDLGEAVVPLPGDPTKLARVDLVLDRRPE